MNDGYSREDLSKFLDYLAAKGLMNSETASARKSSANTLLGILNEDEASDVRNIDLDQVTSRFLNLKGSAFKPASVRVYKSRVEGAIRDFVSYRKDPLSFKPKLEQRSPRSTEKKTKSDTSETQMVKAAAGTSSSFSSMQTEGIVFPIPLRSDVTVKIAGIPPDLTVSEARKIGNVVLALAIQSDV